MQEKRLLNLCSYNLKDEVPPAFPHRAQTVPSNESLLIVTALCEVVYNCVTIQHLLRQPL